MNDEAARPDIARFLERATRREGDREMPLGPKAQRTRNAILAAAIATMAERGYQRTTVADVAEAAGVSLGTVYQYFRDRVDIVNALAARTVTEMIERTDTAWRADEGIDGLFRVVENFVATYAELSAQAAVWEEVSHLDAEVADMRRALGRAFTAPVAAELARAGKVGLLRSDIDARLAAVALTAMVDRFCWLTYVFDPPRVRPDPVEAASVLTELWWSAVQPRQGSARQRVSRARGRSRP